MDNCGSYLNGRCLRCRTDMGYNDCDYDDNPEKCPMGWRSVDTPSDHYLNKVISYVSSQLVRPIHCCECKHRKNINCPMYFLTSEWDSITNESKVISIDHTRDGDWCSRGEQA